MILEQLLLVDVLFENDNQKAVLTFLDEEAGEIREVNFNKQVYDGGEFVDDKDKAEKVESWSKEYFGLEFKDLSQAIGEKKDIYAYDRFNSLFEVKIVEKFGEDMVGQIITGELVEIFDDGIGIKINFEYDDKVYQTKMTYSDYLEVRKEWFVNPQKKDKQYNKFKEKFGVPFEEAESLIGLDVMVEIRKAMGKWIWNDIKPLPKKKKSK